jgi:hypothetical protein
MKFATAASLAAALGLVLATAAQADTRSSDDKAKLERKASPSSGKQDEEQAEAHSQPDNPHPGGTTPRRTTKPKPGASQPKGEKDQKAKGDKSSSAGSSAPAQDGQKELAFKKLDLDGDGSISKAEAAGNEKLMNGFDDADKDRDGKLSRSEYEHLGSPSAAKAKAKSAKVKAQAKAKTAAEPR